MKNATKRKIKKYFSLFITIALVLAIGILAIYFANQKFNFLPASITNIWEDSNSSSIDTSNYKYVSTMTDKIVFADYFDIKVPPESYIPSKNLLDEKYKVYADTTVITMDNVDILIQPYNIEAENTSEFLEGIRADVIANYKESMPTITFNEAKTFNVNGQYITTLWFVTEYKEQTTYTDIAFLEANGKLITVTMNSAYDYIYTQDLFASIINTVEVK